ncbi:hypothetical protein TNCV_4502571 [Trichonephila clavipes]|nr:hypothetical protein TNCV_4502571 [Trichonephila clavipes]
MSSPEFKPSPKGTAVIIAKHYTIWVAPCVCDLLWLRYLQSHQRRTPHVEKHLFKTKILKHQLKTPFSPATLKDSPQAITNCKHDSPKAIPSVIESEPQISRVMSPQSTLPPAGVTSCY